MRQVILSLSLLFLLAPLESLFSQGSTASSTNCPGASTPSSTAQPGEAAKKTPPLDSPEARPDATSKDVHPQQGQPPPTVSGLPPQSLTPGVEPGKMYMELECRVDRTDWQGNGERLFLHEGINPIAKLSSFSNAPIWGIRRLEVLGVGRNTSNPRVDSERNSLRHSHELGQSRDCQG